MASGHGVANLLIKQTEDRSKNTKWYPRSQEFGRLATFTLYICPILHSSFVSDIEGRECSSVYLFNGALLWTFIFPSLGVMVSPLSLHKRNYNVIFFQIIFHR